MDDLHDDLAAHVADELASADGGGQLAPLSDARLAEIREHLAFLGNLDMSVATMDGEWYMRHMHELLAYVDWLREREAALLAERERLLAVVAEARPFLTELAGAHTSFVDDDDVIIKVSPGRAAWVISRARAALASAEVASERA